MNKEINQGILDELKISYFVLRENGEICDFNSYFLYNAQKYDKSVSKRVLDISDNCSEDGTNSDSDEDKLLRYINHLLTNVVQCKENDAASVKLQNFVKDFPRQNEGVTNAYKLDLEKLIKIIINNFNYSIFQNLGVSKIKSNSNNKYFEIRFQLLYNIYESQNFVEFLVSDVTKLYEAEALKTQLKCRSLGLAKIAHEFKNPIITISSLLRQPDPSSSILQTEINDTSSLGEHIDENYDHNKQLEISEKPLILNLCNYLMILIEDFNEFAKMNLDEEKNHIPIIKSQSLPVDFTKSADNKKILMNEIELRPILEFCINIFKIRQKNDNNKPNLKILLSVTKEVPKVVFFNETKLKQVIVNLLSNAYKFTMAGEIILSAVVEKTKNGKKIIRIKVSDSGVGISEEEKDSLFKPFKMLERTQRINKNGSGLGLLIVRDTLSKMNSQIEMVSEKGKGSTFSFDISEFKGNDSIIPFTGDKFCNKIEANGSYGSQNKVYTESLTSLMKTIEDRCVKKSEPKSFSIQPDHLQFKVTQSEKLVSDVVINTAQSKKISFLICDDDKIISNSAVSLVRRICRNYKLEPTIYSVNNGIECIYHIYQKSKEDKYYDFLLIDEEMPFVNGTEVTKFLRGAINSKHLKEISIFAVTANDDINNEAYASNGYVGVLKKPLSKDNVKKILSTCYFK